MVKILPEALSFDDVLIVPGDETAVAASEVDLRSEVVRGVELNIPFISAPMEFSGSALAIRMALEGGLGSLHFNPEDPGPQVKEADRVKRHRAKRITKPVCALATKTVGDVNALERKWGFGSFPVVDESGNLLGLTTSGKRKFCLDPEAAIIDRMVPWDQLRVSHGDIGADKAFEIMLEHEIKFLPVVEDPQSRKLIAMYSFDELMETRVPNSPRTVDPDGRLRVAASVRVHGDMDRAERLVDRGVDILIVDTASGNSIHALQTIARIKRKYPSVKVIGGNVATGTSAMALIGAGADAVRVGVGPGSICTTRIVTGVGVPQLQALLDVADAVRGRVPIIADGGLRNSGDIAKALVVADCVMCGSLFAGTDEALGSAPYYRNGRTWKAYRGMGSLGAMEAGGAGRYGDLIPEGIEGEVPYFGTLAERLRILAGGVRKSLAMVGARTLPEFRQKARFRKITPGGQRESHVHDVTIVREAPNYSP